RVARLGLAPGQRGAQVVVLLIQPRQPRHLLRATQPLLYPSGEVGEPLQVAGSHDRLLASLPQPLRPVLPQRLQQPVARLLAPPRRAAPPSRSPAPPPAGSPPPNALPTSTSSSAEPPPPSRPSPPHTPSAAASVQPPAKTASRRSSTRCGSGSSA